MSRPKLVVAILAAALFGALASPVFAAPKASSQPAAKQGQGQSKPEQAAAKKPKPESLGEKLGIEAISWGLMDARTGGLIASHAAAEKLPIASTTKLMTAYVAMKEMGLEKIVRAAPYDAEYGESLMGLRSGREISVRDLIYGLILRSGNDAAHTLAVRAAGSTEKFVAEMNRYAAALGLADTHYANPIGLDQEGNYSSARDLLTLTRRLQQIPAFAKIADSRSAELTSVTPPRRINTINELLLMEPWVTGVKTGHTWGAAYVLVGSGRRKGVDLISVAIGAPTDETRYSDNLALLEYGFSQYDRRTPVKDGERLAVASIRYSGGSLPLRAADAVEAGVRRGQELTTEVRAPAEVEGPIRRGAVLGRATVFVDGLKAGTVKLEAARAIPKASAFDRGRAFVADNWTPIAIAAFVILMGAIILYRRLIR